MQQQSFHHQRHRRNDRSKILHVITDLRIGGESKHLVRALASLGDFDHVVSYLTVTTDPRVPGRDVRGEIEALGIPLVDLGVSRDQPRSVPRAFARLRRLVRETEPDLVHSTLVHANLLSEPLAWSGQTVLCSYVTTNPWVRGWLHKAEQWVGRRALFVANSRAVADRLIAGGIDPKRLCLLRYGVDTDHFRPEGPRVDLRGERVILGAGRLEPEKGFDHLIEAAALIPERPDVVLVGDGRLRQVLEEHARNRRVSLSVITAVADLAPYLRSAHVVAIPSLYEGLPNVLLEALATASTVVATDLPGHREVIRDRENGLLVPASDPPALARAIRHAPRGDGSLGSEGRRTVLESFRWGPYIERRRLLYEAVVAARRSTR